MEASTALRDVITGPWTSLGELGCSALDVQLRLHEERRQDAEQRTHDSSASGPGGSLFESAAAKIASSIGEVGSDLEAEIQAITSLPPTVVSRAFGEGWERIPYTTLCGLLNRVKSDGQSDAHNTGLLAVDIDEWYCVQQRIVCDCFLKFFHRILKNERWLRDDKRHDWRYTKIRYPCLLPLILT